MQIYAYAQIHKRISKKQNKKLKLTELDSCTQKLKTIYKKWLPIHLKVFWKIIIHRSIQVLVILSNCNHKYTNTHKKDWTKKLHCETQFKHGIAHNWKITCDCILCAFFFSHYNFMSWKLYKNIILSCILQTMHGKKQQPSLPSTSPSNFMNSKFLFKPPNKVCHLAGKIPPLSDTLRHCRCPYTVLYKCPLCLHWVWLVITVYPHS